MYLRHIGGYTWLTRSFVQTKPRTIATPSLRQRPDLAFFIEGWLPFNQGATRPSKIRRETAWWLNSHPMARWTLCHMGCHSHWHRGGILSERNISHCWLSGRGSGLTQGGKVRCDFNKLSLFPTCFRNFRTHKPSWLWFSVYVGQSSFSGLRRSTWIFFSFSTFVCFYSALQLYLFL